MSMSSGLKTSILSSLTSSTDIYYKLGGALLIFIAGVWAFSRIKSLINDEKSFRKNEKRANAFSERMERKNSNNAGRSQNIEVSSNMRRWLAANR